MQLRTLFAAAAIGLSIACIAGLASAQQIYKWKDSGGVIHFSQTPPSTGTNYTKVRLTSQPEVSSAPDTAADNSDQTASEGSGESATQRAGSAATQADTASNRAALCKQLTSNISLLESKQPVIASSNGGTQQVMNDNAREQQLATARAQQAQYCTEQ